MRCPFCGEPDTKVIDSRLGTDNYSIRRRRECLSCNTRFNTSESSDLSYQRVIKSNKSSELFSEEKIRNGVNIALEKRENSIEDIDETLKNIYRKCLTYHEKEIPSLEIGKIVMQELIKLDHVAYLRFASVYLNFDDMSSFRKTIEDLEKYLSPEMKKLQKTLLDEE